MLLSPNFNTYRNTAPKLKYYQGAYDALATFSALRDAKVLGNYSYLHLAPGQAEIGWEPVEHLRLLAGEPCVDWRAKLGSFGNRAEQLGSKAFGYIGFDAVDGHAGTLPDRSLSGRPLVEFIIPSELVQFSGSQVTQRSQSGLDLHRYITAKMPPRRPGKGGRAVIPVEGTSEQVFVEAVRKGMSALAAGHAKKIVLSRYQAYEAEFDPLTLFAALSRPFVDAFLICFGDLVAVVLSPELLLAGKTRQILTNPLAGTRPRGETPEQDDRLRTELIGNHKEIVEHVLSVKTVLSELEPLCEPGRLSVTRFMDVAPQRNVQHLSSVIQGTLRGDHQILDALWALFPAVTVTGLPKQPALEIIRSLETSPRYLYAGVMGWVFGQGDCRFSLAIRGIFRCGTRSFLQAGAGILAGSLPEAELLETSYKLSVMKDALRYAVGATNVL